jgi:hypothetical protein
MLPFAFGEREDPTLSDDSNTFTAGRILLMAMEEEEAISTQPLHREQEIELFYYGSFSLHLLIGRYVGYYLLCNLFSRATSHRQVKHFPFAKGCRLWRKETNFLLISSAALNVNAGSALTLLRSLGCFAKG